MENSQAYIDFTNQIKATGNQKDTVETLRCPREPTTS